MRTMVYYVTDIDMLICVQVVPSGNYLYDYSHNILDTLISWRHPKTFDNLVFVGWL